MRAEQVAAKVLEEFPEMVSETRISDYAVNEEDLGEMMINGKKVTVYIGIRQE